MTLYYIQCHDSVWGYEATTGFFTGEPYRKSRWVPRGDPKIYLYGTYGEAFDVAKRINHKGLPCVGVGYLQVSL